LSEAAEDRFAVFFQEPARHQADDLLEGKAGIDKTK
jgi:hypothetical protein